MKKIFCLMIFIGLILTSCSYNSVRVTRSIDDKEPQNETVPPKFSDFAINSGDKYEGKTAPINFASHLGATMFKTKLIEGIKEAPNFAFYYHLITWGCGTECQQIGIIDARDGKVYFADFASAEGIDFRLDSKLLIVNPIENIIEVYGNDSSKWLDGLYTSYYLWENNKFTLLKEIKATYNMDEVKKEEGQVVRYGKVITFSTSGDVRFNYYDIKKSVVLDSWQGYLWFFASPEDLNDGKKIDYLNNYIKNNQNSIFKITGIKEKDDCGYYGAGACLENITIKEIEKVN